MLLINTTKAALKAAFFLFDDYFLIFIIFIVFVSPFASTIGTNIATPIMIGVLTVTIWTNCFHVINFLVKLRFGNDLCNICHLHCRAYIFHYTLTVQSNFAD